MSANKVLKRNTVPEIYLKNKSKIVSLTCYTSSIAKIADKYADIILVGDSMGMVIYGQENTLSVTKQMMIEHGRAVVKNTKKH